MNDAQYKAPPLPVRHDANVTRSIMDSLGYETDWWAIFIGTILTPGNPLAPLIELEGILTDNYDRPTDPPGGPATLVNVANIAGNSVVTVNNNQPYPVAGFLSLKWNRTPPLINGNTIKKA
jgi:hypothetical protein